MTSCVAIVVPEGIALASDSLASGNGNSQLTIKLFQVVIDKAVYGVCIAGQEKLNNKTVLSIFDFLEKSFDIESPSFNQITDYFARGIVEEFVTKYQDVDIKTEMNREVVFLFCGFENKDVKKPIIQRCHVFGKKDANNTVEIGSKKKLMNFQNRFDAFAIGKKENIRMFISDGSIASSEDHNDFTSMSLANAVAHAEELVGIMCDNDSDCSPPIRSATLTPHGFEKHGNWS